MARRHGVRVEPGAAGRQPRGLALRSRGGNRAQASRDQRNDCNWYLQEPRGDARRRLVAIMKPTYAVTAVRSGRWWAIEVPDLRGVHSQARRLDQVESMAREAIALTLDAPEDSFDVVVEPDFSSLGGVRDAVETALRERERASAAQEAASTAMRHAVSEVRASGYTSRDAGMLLGVSNQRISQIEREAAERRE